MHIACNCNPSLARSHHHHHACLDLSLHFGKKDRLAATVFSFSKRKFGKVPKVCSSHALQSTDIS